MQDTMDPSTAEGGYTEGRPRSEALEIALSVAFQVAKEHAQWRNPEPKPQVAAHLSPAAECVDGAESARVADAGPGVFAGRRVTEC